MYKIQIQNAVCKKCICKTLKFVMYYLILPAKDLEKLK